MGDRYWITGVQLGLLQSLQHEKAREDLVNLIGKNQYIGDKEDLKRLMKVVR